MPYFLIIPVIIIFDEPLMLKPIFKRHCLKGGIGLIARICLCAVFYQANISIALGSGDLPSLEYLAKAELGPRPGETSDGAGIESRVDKTHEMLSSRILATARWMDSFFYDERFYQEDNKTRVKLRTSSFWELEEGVDLRINTNVHLVLPGFEDRLALVFSGDDDGGIGLSSSDDLDITSLKRTSKEDTNVAVRYNIEMVERRNISAAFNLRWRESRLVSVPEVRWRETISLDHWELRFLQKFRWYSDVGWEALTSFDFDRLIHQGKLFRTTLSGVWSEEEEAEKGYSYNLDFSFFHPLSPDYAVTYEIKNNFQVKPFNRLEETVFRFRYRQKLWRDWLFLEMAPQIAFPRDRNFRLTPGFLFFVEAIFGHYKKK